MRAAKPKRFVRMTDSASTDVRAAPAASLLVSLVTCAVVVPRRVASFWRATAKVRPSASIERAISVDSGVTATAAGSAGLRVAAAICSAATRSTLRCVTALPPLVACVEICATSGASECVASVNEPSAAVVAVGSPASQTPLLLVSKQTVAPW